MRAFLAATLALFAFASATPDVDPRSREAGLSLYDSSEPIRLQPRSTSSFKAAVLQVHNSNRRNHGARALVWSDSLARGAGKWASRCRFEHGGLGNNQGQSASRARACAPKADDRADIAAGTPVVLTAFVDRTGFNSFTKVMQAFMAERKDYNPNNPQASHYTQGPSALLRTG